MFSSTSVAVATFVPEIFAFSDRLEALLYFPIAHWAAGFTISPCLGGSSRYQPIKASAAAVAGLHICSLARFGSLKRRLSER